MHIISKTNEILLLAILLGIMASEKAVKRNLRISSEGKGKNNELNQILYDYNVTKSMAKQLRAEIKNFNL